MSVVRRASGGRLNFKCPGCNSVHSVKIEGPGAWQWNGSAEHPTLTPSVLVTGGPNPRQFPVLHPKLGGFATVPWPLLAPHEEQAKLNHRQTLERLAERGGLDYSEMLAILENRDWTRDLIPGADVEIARRVNAWFEAAPNETCHSFIRDGRIEFLSDCTHKLAGQTVPLEEF